MQRAKAIKSDLSQESGKRREASLRRDIEAAITRHLDDGRRAPQTLVPGLLVARMVRPLPPTPHVYEPTLFVCLRGEKRVSVGDRNFHFDREHFFLTSIDVPTVIAIDEASPEAPYVALQLRLDLDAARLLISDMEALYLAPAQADDPGVVIGPLTEELLDPLSRLVKLLEAPRDVQILADLLHREILYRLLAGPKGARLREIAKLDSQAHQVAKAVRWLRENFAEKLRIEDLARIAGMGTSTLHRHFSALTTVSPIQFQKSLRLHEARRLMLTENLDAAVAAQRVGYESATHFNHDYRRMFGRPPRKDVTFLRTEPGEPGDERKQP